MTKSNGSVYVAAVFAVLVGYFAYQWWFNPHRVIKRRLGELAATLSVPPQSPDTARLARLAKIREYFAERVSVAVAGSAPDTMTGEALAAMVARLTPPGGVNVDFVDVQINVDADSSARAYLGLEVTMRDPVTGLQTLDAREASASFVRDEDEWVISAVEVKPAPQPR